MSKFAALFALCLTAAPASAEEITSAYTKFDLQACKLVEKGDEYVYAGTWRCKGLAFCEIEIGINAGDLPRRCDRGNHEEC